MSWELNGGDKKEVLLEGWSIGGWGS
jgi:hypothetical protein